MSFGAGAWSDNPYNNVNSFKNHALPKLLFDECHKNCVDFDYNPAENAED